MAITIHQLILRFTFMRTLKLIGRFHLGFFLPDFLVTLSCLGLLGFYGTKAHEILSILVWYKVISMTFILYAALQYKKKELYYYQNLGVSKLTLAVFTTIANFMLFMVLFITVYHSL
ncbi:hypothetical protein SAMN05216464_10497 [Mucilaginibacter pineti]|uniref:Uncharacterized protein n=1 Tax=Mucilaginibacter pineti TaxID=1391627 RepID=A0A1G7AH69_9SPHI|nr:hypothetical protein [Mucilaginibacter pineti]SDE14053.1 hypothetical protein SAMN05216464_10497 [Mucilaginibacter pineti]